MLGQVEVGQSLTGAFHLMQPVIDAILDHLQSDLGYPATSGPAHIRISDLAGYERYAWTQQLQ